MGEEGEGGREGGSEGGREGGEGKGRITPLRNDRPGLRIRGPGLIESRFYERRKKRKKNKDKYRE